MRRVSEELFFYPDETENLPVRTCRKADAVVCVVLGSYPWNSTGQ